MRGGDEDVFDGGVEALQDGEVKQARALGVHGQVRRHFAPVWVRRRRHREVASALLRVGVRGGGSESYQIGRAHV